MGATNFYDTVYGHKHTHDGMVAAYIDAVSEAAYMDGHDSYSGTIATTNGVSPHTTTVYDADSEELGAVADKALDAAQKWGDALAIPVREVEPETWGRSTQYTLNLSLPVEHLEVVGGKVQVADDYRKNLNSRVLRALRGGKGDVKAPTYGSAGPDQRNASGLQVRELTVKVGTSSAPEMLDPIKSPGILYQVYDGARRVATLPTLTKARAEAKRLAAKAGKEGRTNCTLSIEPVLDAKCQETYTVPVFNPETCTKKTVTATITVTVAVTRSERKLTGRKGWLFVGWAAC